jgi:glycosyltransferase involved in cell wall biosynthesis
MNVLHINQSDLIGGASIAGYRLHEGLLAQGVDSRLLVGKEQTSSDRVAVIKRNPIEKQLNSLTWRLGLNYIHCLSTFDIPKHNFYKDADVLNFHNLHSGYFNYLALPKLTQHKPAVLTLHDMWSFTGHCAYSYECDRWKSGCGKCPHPDVYPPIKLDNTRLEWQMKNWAYHRSTLTIVAPSNWLTKLASCSILNRFSIHCIPNGIDTEVYQPLDREQCRSVLNIAKNKKVLMFGADNLTDARKGGDLLLKALASLQPSLKAQTLLLTLGNGGEAIAEKVGIQTLNLGYVTSDRLKSIAYSAADLFIFPTRADNLPLMLQESLSCGLPVISFDIGGVPDLVRPGVTGYLAVAEDISDFSHGIIQLLEDKNLRDRISKQCREIALQEYSLVLQAQRYIDLYRAVQN